MKPAEILRDEHELIRLGLNLLSRMCERMDKGEKVELLHLEKVIEFIAVFADECHHGKEEELLFPAMEAGGVQREGGPLCAMLMEHQMGRHCMNGMKGALADMKKEKEKAGVSFVRHTIDYLNILSQHIEKENHCLFPMIEMVLSPEKQSELAEDFMNLEITKIGRGKRQEFERCLNELQIIYSA